MVESSGSGLSAVLCRQLGKEFQRLQSDSNVFRTSSYIYIYVLRWLLYDKLGKSCIGFQVPDIDRAALIN
jgi:hypothetical protein